MMSVHWVKADLAVASVEILFDRRVRPLKPAVGGGQIPGAYRRWTAWFIRKKFVFSGRKTPPAMRGRNPLIPNVIPMRPDAAVDGEAREKELKREAKRKARKLMPKGLNERLQKEWLFWAEQFAHSRLDRLE